MAILTISRELGSGGREVGHAIADVMGYEYVDRKTILDDMREKGKIWEEKAKRFDENYPELWERNDWTYRGFVSLNQSHFLDHAVKGNAVIMGRGGNFLLNAFPMVLKVRTMAPIESRIERVMSREGINYENARYLIEKADSEMAKAVYLIYGKHWDDPEEYDLVFDTSKEGQVQIVATVRDALLAKERYNTEEARNGLRLRALAEKIKAAVLTDPTFVISLLDVDPKEEGLSKFGLELRGIVHELEDIKAIEKMARKMAGDIPVESHLQYRMYPRLGRR
jgi:cytidylate kinase